MKFFGLKQVQTSWRSRAHCVWFRLCMVCLSVYIAYITYFAHSSAFVSPGKTALAIVCFLLLSAGVYLLLDRATAWLCSCGLSGKQHARIDLRVLAAAFAIALVIFGCAFAACYPGGVNYDISNQWRQAHSGEFNNWHPLMHTLILWALTQVIDRYPFVLLVQIVLFSAAFAYLTAVLHKRGVPAWLALTAECLVALSSPVRGTLMYAGKDSAMTIGVLLLSAWTVEMLFSNGEWLKKPFHIILLGVALTLTTLLRHNAMMWTYVLIVCIFFCFKACRKAAVLAAAVMVILLVLIQGPLFGCLNVVYPDNFVDESMGIPMTILADTKVQQPEKLDGETNAFLATLATDEEWQTTYRLHNYNSIKFTFDREYVARKPLADILSMTARTAMAAPRIAFEAFNGLTDLVWDITGQNESTISVRNSGDIPEEAVGNATLNGLGGKMVRLFDGFTSIPPLAWLTRNVGVQQLLLLLVTLWAMRRHGVKVLVLTLPTLLYDLGTMMLLASNDARFFQFSMTIALPMMLAMLFVPREEHDVCR